MSPTRIIMIGLAGAATALTPAAAIAKDGDVRVRGACSKSSTAKLKLSAENSRIETEFEVDQNRNGVKWTVTIKRNGTTVVKTSAKTSGPSGSFSIQRRLSDGAGADTISARAKNSSGQLCTASLRI